MPDEEIQGGDTAPEAPSQGPAPSSDDAIIDLAEDSIPEVDTVVPSEPAINMSEDSAPFAEEATTPEEVPVPEEPVIESPQLDDIAPPPPDEPVMLDEATSEILGSDDFAEWAGQVIISFLDIMDIEHPGQRRAAIIDLAIDEDGIKKRLDLSESLMKIKAEYGIFIDSQEMIDSTNIYNTKIAAMRAWLGM